MLTVPVGLLLGALALWQVGKARIFQFFGALVPRVNTTEKLVALTFDDGPTPQGTREILRVLDEMQVKATFFLIGSELAQNLAEDRHRVAAGHKVGTHSYSHTRMLLVAPAFVQQEIEKTDQLIRAIGYTQPIHFRPPNGKKLFALPWYLAKTNRR